MKAIFLICLLALTGCAHRVTNGVPNFAVVDHDRRIFRGGQPDASGWDYLRQLGVTNVLKLNPKDEGEDDLGFKSFYCPISFAQQIGQEPLYSTTVAEAAICIRPGTYVHCTHGQDRTGLVCAVYRVKVDGWTKEQAEAEMLANGFHKELRGLWEFWSNWEP